LDLFFILFNNMATLSGQTIQSTYNGLLKLADSTTGITDSYQQIQDGLGNDTGILLKNNYIFDSAHITKTIFKPISLGTGFINTSTFGYGNISNYLCAIPFWDNGQYEYSSITVNVRTVTSTSDVLTFAFYNSQVTSNGILPKDLIMSGITIPVNALNKRTVTLPSNLIFSATPGLNWLMFKVTNGGVSPTLRLGTPAINNMNTALFNKYGYANSAGLYFTTTSTLSQSIATNIYAFSGLTNYEVSFTESTIVNAQSIIPLGGQQPFGFLLNLI